MSILATKEECNMKTALKFIRISGILLATGGFVVGCRSYRYVGFDFVPESVPRDVRLVVTNLVLNVKTDSSRWNFSETTSYDTFSMLQSVKGGDNEVVLKDLNSKLAERAVTTAKVVPVTVMIDSNEVQTCESSAAYWWTLGVVSYQRLVEERCRVSVYIGDVLRSGSIHVCCEGKRSAFSPGGLFVPDTPDGATYTQAACCISWRDFLGSWFPLFQPPNLNDVFVCDLADVLVTVYHGRNVQR